MSILAGIRAVAIPGPMGAAAWAAKHLADWGAEVTLLEPPEGAALREAPPWYEVDGERRSATWTWVSRGATSVRVGEELETTPAVARAACERADVVVIDSEMAERLLGLAPSELRGALEGRTTALVISPFGLDGPYADYRASDLGVNSLGGWTGMLGEPDREPLRPGADMNARVSGVYAFDSLLVALFHRARGAAPAFIEISQQAVATASLTAPWMVYSMTAGAGAMQRRPSVWPHCVVPCKDGWSGIAPLTYQHWELLCQMLGIDDILEESWGRDPAWRQEHGNELLPRVTPWFAARTREEIYYEAQAWRLPAGPVDTVEQREHDPQLTARGFFLEREIDGATVKVPRVPYLLSTAAPAERGDLAEADRPAIGESSVAPAAGDGGPALPFEGVRVVDMTWFWSGPHCTMTMGAFGADVIKVESIQRPDSYRYTAVDPSQDRWYERGALWNDTNPNKRSVTLNLESETGMAYLVQLLEQADVVVSNFSNRVLPNLGLTVERFHEINPNLIVALLPGYGPDGPWGQFVGYGVSFENAVVAQLTGYPDDRPLMNGGFSDTLVGMHALAGITLALHERERSGTGSYVEAPQCEILDSLLGPEHIAVGHGEPSRMRMANRHESMAPHNVYRVAGDDEWISIAVATDEEFAALATAIGAPQLAGDERFATAQDRKAHEDDLDAAIAAAVAGSDLVELERTLQAAGVMGCRVSRPYLLTEDENLVHLDFFQELDREVTGTHPFKTFPFRFSTFGLRHRLPPPLLGQHNHEVLRDLGADEATIRDLEERQEIGVEPIGFNA